MQMRRMQEEEEEVAEPLDSHLFCFHVRLPRRAYGTARPESSFFEYPTTVAGPDDEDRFDDLYTDPTMLSFQPMDELQLTNVVPPKRLAKNVIDAGTGMRVIDTPGIFTLRVHSFLPALNRKHGLLWCTV